MNKNYTTIVGLETHVELKTKSKMFCGCDANWFGKSPNTHTCPVCLGLPGALPVPNKKAVDWTIMLGLALNCTIAQRSKFDRKNYFYPDLPKGYQISQYDEPLAVNGFLEIPMSNEQKTTNKIIRIRRVHLEEDTGKLMHAVVDSKQVSLVDFNRSGVPLVEIVTEPDIRSSEEAVSFMKYLHAIIRSLGISDADMEKGSMRIEPNISVLKIQGKKESRGQGRIKEKDLPKYKVEVKNINSFRFAKRSIDFEVARHIELLESGQVPKQETRGWSEDKKATVSQRSKEEASDYRYFPEPDIPPMEFTEEYIKEIKKQLPKLPAHLAENLVKEHGIKKEYAEILAKDAVLFQYFEESRNYGIKDSIDTNIIVAFIVNKKVDINRVSPEQFINDLKSQQHSKVSDEDELVQWINEAISQLPQVVADYKSGKQAAIGALIGRVMQISKGHADAKRVVELTRKLLSS